MSRISKRILEQLGKRSGSSDFARKPAKSLFEDADYDFDISTTRKELSEFDMAYKGKPSKLDTNSFDEEYRERRAVKVKQVTLQPKSQLDDDKEDDVATERKRSFVMPYPPGNGPTHATPIVTVQKHNDDVEKIDRALAIAEDFSKREKLIIIGGAICRYNGKFYSILSEDVAQRLIFQNYRR